MDLKNKIKKINAGDIWLLTVLIFCILFFIGVAIANSQYDPYIPSALLPIILFDVIIGAISFLVFIVKPFQKNEKKKILNSKKNYVLIVILAFTLTFLLAFLLPDDWVQKTTGLDKTNSTLMNKEFNINQALSKLQAKPFTEESMENEINKYREDNNLEVLDRHEPLCDIAKIRVYEIKKDWSHNGFESRTDGELYKYCNTKDLKCTGIGENLAKDYSTVDAVINGWKSSDGHNKNMLGNYNVQCVIIDNGYVVSLFALTEGYKPIVKDNQDTTGTQNTGNGKVPYDYESVVSWEKSMNSDQKAVESWESAMDSDWYDTKKVAEMVRKLKRVVEIERTIWDGITNSKITWVEFNSLKAERDELSKDITDLRRELMDGAYDECVKSWEEMEKTFDKDYSDQIKDCKRYLN